MKVVQGWPGFYFYKRNMYMPELSNFHSFLRHSPFTLTHLPIILANYWCQQYIRFYPECIASSGHSIWVHHQFEISVILCVSSLVQTKVTWGLVKVVHDFPPHCCQCHLHQIFHVDEYFHAAGWSSLAVSQAFSSKLLGAYYCDASYCNTVH